MKIVLFLCLFAGLVLAQQPVSTRPDCTLPLGTLAGPAPQNTTPFDNRVAGCTTWQIVYNSTGFSALSIVVQTAPNNGGVPGAWSTFTAVTGSNPNTATTEAVSTFGGITSYFPWLRVQLTSITGTGTISGQLFGWRTGSQPGGGTGAGCPNPCPVIGTAAAGAPPSGAPVQVGGWDGTDIQIIKTDTSGDVLNVAIGNAAVLSGQQAVTNSAVALATHAAKNICVKAFDANTASVYIGPSGVSTSTGMELGPGESYCAPVTNTNLIFVIAAAGGSSVSWISTN